MVAPQTLWWEECGWLESGSATATVPAGQLLFPESASTLGPASPPQGLWQVTVNFLWLPETESCATRTSVDSQCSWTRLILSSLLARQKSNASEGDSCFKLFSIPYPGPTPVPCLVPLDLLPILLQGTRLGKKHDPGQI